MQHPLSSSQSWMFLFEKNTEEEEVTTFIGKSYLVYVSESQPYQTGFFGLLVQPDAQYRLVFFTAFGVRKLAARHWLSVKSSRRKEQRRRFHSIVLKEQENFKKRQLGEIIADNENVPHDDIETTFEEAKRNGRIPLRARVGEILIGGARHKGAG